MAYDNTNSGIFYKNDRKEKDNHPDYKGSINIDGVDYWLSGWVKVNREDASKRFISLAVQPKQQRAPQRQAPSHDAVRARQLPPRASSGFDDMNDDIPF